MPKKKNTFKIKGDELMKFCKKMIREGNIRRIVIRDTKGKTYAEIPVTIGIIGFVIAPLLIAVAAVAAMVEVFEVEIVRRNGKK
ncbi:DUF4342 domain-containing protein [Candidatus Peregrinibacteria bacterium]|nr:DUF4342 domain-containing protein [Candidatus Peregrinibacteria bacterium]